MTGKEEEPEARPDGSVDNQENEPASTVSQSSILRGAVDTTNDSARWLSRRRRLYVFAAVGLALFWCLMTVRFFQSFVLETPFGRTWGVSDDIYISADFARTLAEGQGLRWYPGAPKVEGFSNPLWVLVLAAIHLVPGFKENALGLWVLGINLCIVVSLAFVFVRGLWRYQLFYESANTRLFYAIALGAGAVPICDFCGIGTEFGLVALLSLWALVESVREPKPRPWLIGTLIALAFLTRMDALIPCAAAFLVALLRFRKLRPVATMVVIIASAIALLLISRKLYFDQWLPNTYFLKSTGWPLKRRLFEGAFLNSVTIGLTTILAFPFLSIALPRARGVQLVVVAAFLSHVLTLAYTVRNGGDSFFLILGFDRFTSVGAVLFMFALAVLVLRVKVRKVFVHLFGIGALLVMLAPAIHTLSTTDLARHYFCSIGSPYPKDTITERFIHTGKILKTVSKPGARVAVCGAGAIVYFSHRGGVDVLGKIDPYVARLEVPETFPPERRCIRLFPGAGHNKEDIPNLFRMRQPDISVLLPPKAELNNWVMFKKDRIVLYARKDNPNVNWNKTGEISPAK